MPETVPTPTDQTGPLDAGHTTSEYAQTRIVVILASVIGVVGTISTVLETVTAVIPPAAQGLGKWLAIGGAVVATLKVIAYEVQRAAIKVAALKAGVTIAAPVAADDAAANLGK